MRPRASARNQSPLIRCVEAPATNRLWAHVPPGEAHWFSRASTYARTHLLQDCTNFLPSSCPPPSLPPPRTYAEWVIVNSLRVFAMWGEGAVPPNQCEREWRDGNMWERGGCEDEWMRVCISFLDVTGEAGVLLPGNSSFALGLALIDNESRVVRVLSWIAKLVEDDFLKRENIVF